ncbi:hypothetical protein [Streptomyces sp. NPDC056194]
MPIFALIDAVGSLMIAAPVTRTAATAVARRAVLRSVWTARK